MPYTETKLPVGELPDCREQPICDPRPPCPVCGGLECLCRPRFFAGQLLTEDDLNRLERYVIDKNKLHNRYLFGPGVVCGLEVVCSVCDDGSRGTVVVKPGYALSPCGNDIVVCKQEPVDICDLINRCRPPTDECLDPHPVGVECTDAAEDWVLAVCYDEKPSRGITALRGAGRVSSCDCGCTCGGCDCGCSGGHSNGGHGNTAKTAGGYSSQGKAYAKKPPALPQFAAQCEPTLICEGYRFMAYKAPKKTTKTGEWGELVKRFVCCIVPLFEALGQVPTQAATKDKLQDWYLELKQTIRDFIIGQGLYDCDITQRFALVQDPDKTQGSDAYRAQLQASTLSLLGIGILVVQKCLCASLLPPCPDPALADCVPLATVTVRRNPCRVVQICNLSARQFLLTLPNIAYWLSWLPLFGGNALGTAREPTLRQLLEVMCCTPIETTMAPIVGQGVNLGIAALPAEPAAPAAPLSGAPAPEAARAQAEASNGQGAGGEPRATANGTARKGAFAELWWKATTEKAPRMNAARFTLGAMGATDLQRQPLATEAELAQPAAAILLSQVVGPALRTLIPPDIVERRRDIASAGAVTEDARREQEIAALKGTIEELKARIDRQQADIDRLLNR
jgi:hypothetical protein